MTQEITLRIILEQPPAEVAIGLQKGTGRTYETLQIQKAQANNLIYVCSILLKGDKQTDPTPTLSGPFVQGPKGQKFVYLDIGTCAGQTDSIWSRRLKIPLSGISWDLIEQVAYTPHVVLEARVPGTDQNGEPSCATVKPFSGWHLASDKDRFS